MTWLTFLSNASAVAQISANVIILFYVYPAFRQTKQRGFLFIGIACLIGTFDTLWDHTFGLYRMSHEEYVMTRTLRRFAYFATVAFETTGIVLLTQRYLYLLRPKPADSSPPDLP